MAAENDETKKYITSKDLKKHNKPGDLWISIQGKVYNVFEWVKQHPGGDIPILNLAGQDVTDTFIAYNPSSTWKHLEPFFTGFQLRDFKVSEISRDYRKLAAEFSKLGIFENKGHRILYTLVSIAIMLAVVVYRVLKYDSVLVMYGVLIDILK